MQALTPWVSPHWLLLCVGELPSFCLYSMALISSSTVTISVITEVLLIHITHFHSPNHLLICISSHTTLSDITILLRVFHLAIAMYNPQGMHFGLSFHWWIQMKEITLLTVIHSKEKLGIKCFQLNIFPFKLSCEKTSPDMWRINYAKNFKNNLDTLGIWITKEIISVSRSW